MADSKPAALSERHLSRRRVVTAPSASGPTSSSSACSRSATLVDRHEPGRAAGGPAVPEGRARPDLRAGGDDRAPRQHDVVDHPAALRLSVRPRARRWMLPVSVFLSGVGLALTGSPRLLVAARAGHGHGPRHRRRIPEGYRTATGVAGERKATALSWFSLGGNIGIAIGPPIITLLVPAGARGRRGDDRAVRCWSLCCSGGPADDLADRAPRAHDRRRRGARTCRARWRC